MAQNTAERGTYCPWGPSGSPPSDTLASRADAGLVSQPGSCQHLRPQRAPNFPLLVSVYQPHRRLVIGPVTSLVHDSAFVPGEMGRCDWQTGMEQPFLFSRESVF